MFIPTSKTKYKVALNWYGEIHVLYTYANTKHRAKANVLTQFAKKIKRERNYVSLYFYQDKNNIKIEEV